MRKEGHMTKVVGMGHSVRGVAALALAAWCGCEAGDARDRADAPDAAEAVDAAVDADDAEAADDTDGVAVDSGAGHDVDPTAIQAGPRACCLTMEGELVVWSDDGDLYQWDAATQTKAPLVVGPGLAKDPALAGGRLVWADNRGGDFDLWTMQLTPVRGTPTLLRGGEGDQDQPALDGTRLVWIGTDTAPHTAREAEVYTADLAVAGSERRLTNDPYEQTQPDLSGDRIVWADFAHSPDAMYIDVADPLRNNADIFGWDLAADTGFVVTQEATKQLRPAIDGDVVVWLDWRGINPEPKYSEFQVFARRLGRLVDGLEVAPGPERRLAWSSWSRPELWRRPAVSGDIVVFIAEPQLPGAGYVTGLLAVGVDGGEPWLVAGSASVLDSVVVDGADAAFVGSNALGRLRLPSARP